MQVSHYIPSVRYQVFGVSRRFHRHASNLLEDSGMTLAMPSDPAPDMQPRSAAEAASRQQGEAVVQLLGSFRHLEAVIVAAESLHLRLPDLPHLADRALRHALHLPAPLPGTHSSHPDGIPSAGPSQLQQASSQSQPTAGNASMPGTHSHHPVGSSAALTELEQAPSQSHRDQQQATRDAYMPNGEATSSSHAASGNQPVVSPANPEHSCDSGMLHHEGYIDGQRHVPHESQSTMLPSMASGLDNQRWHLQSGVDIQQPNERDAILDILEGLPEPVDNQAEGDSSKHNAARPGQPPPEQALIGEAKWVIMCTEPACSMDSLQHRFYVKASTGSMRLAQTISCRE